MDKRESRVSRKKYFYTGLASSYLLIALNFGFTAFSVPLALHYLTKAEFGVWALVVQFSAYLLLIDMGVSASVSRLLADHKDDKEGAGYGKIFYSSLFLSVGQGLALFGMGAVVSWLAPVLANVPGDLRTVFSRLLILQAAVTALSLAFRSLSSPLWSHQRLDISNVSNGLGLLLGLAGLWWGFTRGWGLYSLIFGTSLGAIPGLIVPFLACRLLGYYPPWGGWRQMQKSDWKNLFCFSRDVFMVQVGSQLASATQIIVVSRFMSVESAAIWAIATKAYMLGQQICQRVMDASAGALAEMSVRQERGRLAMRFGQVVESTAWFSAVAGLAIIFLNTPLVILWTGGRIIWPAHENIWLALLLLSTCAARCHLSLGGITKEMSTLRWIQMAEGVAMLGISMLLVNRLGFLAILMGSLAANLSLTLITAQRLSSQRLGVPTAEMLGWILPSFLFLLVGSCVVSAIEHFSPATDTGLAALILRCGLAVFLSALSFRFCIRPETRHELLLRFFPQKRPAS